MRRGWKRTREQPSLITIIMYAYTLRVRADSTPSVGSTNLHPGWTNRVDVGDQHTFAGIPLPARETANAGALPRLLEPVDAEPRKDVESLSFVPPSEP